MNCLQKIHSFIRGFHEYKSVDTVKRASNKKDKLAVCAEKKGAGYETCSSESSSIAILEDVNKRVDG